MEQYFVHVVTICLAIVGCVYQVDICVSLQAYNNEAIIPCRPGRFPRANKQMKLLERQIEEKHHGSCAECITLQY